MTLIEPPRRGRPPNSGKFIPSEEQIAKLSAMYEAGESYAEMARFIGKHSNTVVRVLPTLGLTGRTTRWTPELIAKLRECFDRGLTSPMVEQEWGGEFTALAIRSKWKALKWRRDGVRLIYRQRNSHPINGWDQERLALLRQYWDLGLSASQIGLALGGLSRNSILGKAFRLGLPPRRESKLTTEELTARRNERQRKWYWANHEKAIARLRTVNAKRSKQPKQQKLPVVKLSQRLADTPEPTPSSSVTFMEIKAHQCRWVHGEPKGAETLFCGADVIEGQSYCAHHYLRTRSGARA